MEYQLADDGKHVWKPYVAFDGENLLVGGFNPSEKYESQLGVWFPIYGKNMFHATNQKYQLIYHFCLVFFGVGDLGVSHSRTH